MTFHSRIAHPIAHKKHDRSVSLVPTKADLRWLDGLPDPAVFDGLDQPWWRLAARAAALQLAVWASRRRNRRALAAVDSRTLRDAGIDPGAAGFEAAQPFWKTPIRLRDIPAAD